MTTHTLTAPDTLLRKALRANSAFSLASGLLLTFAAASIASFLGIEETSIFDGFDGTALVRVVGIGLIGYALLLYFFTQHSEITPMQGMEAVIADGAWVVGSVVLLLTDWLPLTSAGSWAILLVADVVLVFAIVQYIGVRRIKQGA